jgi:WD40 repeat protein
MKTVLCPESLRQMGKTCLPWCVLQIVFFLQLLFVDPTVMTWHASDGGLKKDEGGHASVSFSPNGKLVASGGNNCTHAELWTANNRDPNGLAVHGCKEDEEGNSTACAILVAFATNGQTLASGGTNDKGKDSCIFLWDV